jgi:chaperonin GroES
MKFSITDILASNNLAEKLTEKERSDLGTKVIENFEKDKRSRLDWEKRQADAMKLALQVVETKSFPWPNASNVKFPLITIAALQFHARAYPALLSGPELVKMRVVGKDADGKLGQKAVRVAKHMSWQILEEDENWEDQMDKVLITQPIVGCAFKKTYYDSIAGHNVSENILANDLVVDYYTKSLDTASRISHVLYLSKNDIYERVVRGTFLDAGLGNERQAPKSTLKIEQDKAQGINEPGDDEATKPKEVIEQHCWIDLDKDGYEEPYVVVVHRETKKLLRLVARFELSGVTFGKGSHKNTILKITPEQYFTKYPFIPSPDGGFYDLGFGSLLGPLNESINTVINQLIDAGTMSVTAGGFLSRGIKIRGGTLSFQPNEWKPVESTGDDLRKGIMPLPVREPNQVLFTLLNLLINYGERIGGSVDILVGENPGQNTPAETSRTMAEQGMKIFSGIYKRNYRSLKEEFRKWYRLNQLHMTENVTIGDLEILEEDYVGTAKDIIPAADPKMVSDSQKVQQALMLKEIANPMFGYNMYEVQKRLLKAYGIEDMEQVLPDPKGPNAMPPFKPPQVQIEEIKVQGGIKKEETKQQGVMQKAQMEAQGLIAELTLEAGKVEAEIELLRAQALKVLEEADSEKAKIQIAAIDAQIGIQKHQQEHVLKTLDLMHKVVQADEENKIARAKASPNT